MSIIKRVKLLQTRQRRKRKNFAILAFSPVKEELAKQPLRLTWREPLLCRDTMSFFWTWIQTKICANFFLKTRSPMMTHHYMYLLTKKVNLAQR